MGEHFWFSVKRIRLTNLFRSQKSYLLNNFAAVVAIITSLQTPMVAMSMKRFWGRVGMWEMRVFEDLKEFSSPRGNFKFIRDAIAALIDQRDDSSNGMASAQSSVSSRAAKMPADRGVAPASCIPFIGTIFIRLYRPGPNRRFSWRPGLFRNVPRRPASLPQAPRLYRPHIAQLSSRRT